MRYFIVDGFDDCKISEKVDEWMQHGWKPQGGVCVTIIPAGGAGYFDCIPETEVVYSQAIIHESDDPFYPGITNT